MRPEYNTALEVNRGPGHTCVQLAEAARRTAHLDPVWQSCDSRSQRSFLPSSLTSLCTFEHQTLVTLPSQGTLCADTCAGLLVRTSL